MAVLIGGSGIKEMIAYDCLNRQRSIAANNHCLLKQFHVVSDTYVDWQILKLKSSPLVRYFLGMYFSPLQIFSTSR